MNSQKSGSANGSVNSKGEVSSDPIKGMNHKWKIFLDIISIAFLILFFYGLFFYLPSTIKTEETNCDDPLELMFPSYTVYPVIPAPCDTILTMHPLRHWPK